MLITPALLRHCAEERLSPTSLDWSLSRPLLLVGAVPAGSCWSRRNCKFANSGDSARWEAAALTPPPLVPGPCPPASRFASASIAFFLWVLEHGLSRMQHCRWRNQLSSMPQLGISRKATAVFPDTICVFFDGLAKGHLDTNFKVAFANRTRTASPTHTNHTHTHPSIHPSIHPWARRLAEKLFAKALENSSWCTSGCW